MTHIDGEFQAKVYGYHYTEHLLNGIYDDVLSCIEHNFNMVYLKIYFRFSESSNSLYILYVLLLNYSNILKE